MLENSSTIQLTHDLGRFADLTALQAQYPTGRPGDFARLTSTETIWNWTGAAWVDTLVDASTIVGGIITFDNTDPETIGNAPAGKTYYGSYNSANWFKDENGVIAYTATTKLLSEAVIKGAAYKFDGVDGYLSSLLDLTNDYFTLAWKGICNNTGLGGDYGGLIKLGGNELSKYGYGGTARLVANGVTFTTSGDSKLYSNSVLDTETELTIFAILDNGTAYIYINGKLDATDTYTGTPSDLGSSVLTFGGDNSTTRLNGNAYYCSLLNKALTASEVAAFSINPHNIPFELEGASNDEMVNNGAFEAGASSPPANWLNLGNHVGTSLADVTAPEGNNVCEVVASGTGSSSADNVYQPLNLAGDKVHKISFYTKSISGESTLKVRVKDDATFTSAIEMIGSWVYHAYYFTSSAVSNILYFYVVGGAGTFRLDNVTVTQIGEVAAFHPSGIGHNGWKDKYGLFAKNNGATPFNLAANHDEEIILEATASVELGIQPAGYRVEGISVKNNDAAVVEIKVQQEDGTYLIGDAGAYESIGANLSGSFVPAKQSLADTDKTLDLIVNGTGKDVTVFVHLKRSSK